MELNTIKYKKNFLFFIFIFFAILALLSTPILSLGEDHIKIQTFDEKERIGYKSDTRRILVGLGSFPPRCSRKCGRCKPCRPVHVTVPPGIPVTTEYYPEAWRCKCHNKLYMP